ncbi:MAG: hypothetical protein WHT82_00105 [Limisphaera sp.]
MVRNRSGLPQNGWWRRNATAGWLGFGLCLVLATLVVSGRRLWLAWEYPRAGVEVAEALGRFSVIQKPPLVDAGGRRLGLIRTTGRGIEVAVVEPAVAREEQLLEIWDGDYDPGTAHVFSWDAEGTRLAFGMTNTVHFWEQGGGVQRAPVGQGLAGVQWWEGRGWLCLDRGRTLRLFRRTAAGWEEAETWQLPGGEGALRGLRILSPDMIAWVVGPALWRGSLTAREWSEVWRAEAGEVTWVDYEPQRDALLVTYSFRTNRVTTCRLVAVEGLRRGASTARVLAEGESILEGQWVMGGEGWAYRTVRNGKPRLRVRAQWLGREREVLEDGAVYSFCTAERGRALFVHGSVTNEPPGVWRYEIGSESLTCAWWPGEPGVALPPLQPVLTARAPYGSGHWAMFDLVPPADYRRGKKYPLVIVLGAYEWTPIAHGVSAQALARAGAYVALVRYRWDQRRIETIYDHTNHVLAVERVMRAHPSVDGDRVYLLGFSAGTLTVNALAEMYPGRYRGLMLCNRGDLPKPQVGLTDRILVTHGEREQWSPAEAARHGAEFCQVGIPMEYHVHPGGRHIIRSKESLRERALWKLDFVFGR